MELIGSGAEIALAIALAIALCLAAIAAVARWHKKSPSRSRGQSGRHS